MPKTCGIWGCLFALVALVWALAGCGKDDAPSSPADSEPSYDLVIVSGNNQTGQPGERLKQPLQVEAVNRQGYPVSGVVVRFSVAAGGGVLSDSTGITGVSGRVWTLLTLGATPGVNKVTVTAEDLAGLPPTFTAVAEGEAPGDPVSPISGRLADAAHFSLAPEKLNVPGGVQFGLTNRVTAFVFDADSNPVSEGTAVRFQTTGGGIEGTARTDASGRAVATLTTAQPLPDDGWVTVTAEAQGRGDSLVTAQTRVLFSGHSDVRLIQPASFSVPAGQTQAFLFFVGDANGHPLSAGTTVRVTAVGGTVSGQTDVTLPDTQSPDATRFSVLFQAAATGGTPEMAVEVVSPNGDRKLTLISGARPGGGGAARVAASLAVAVSDSLLVADGTSETTVVATVQDSLGNGVPNQAVSFTATAGTVDATALTDAAGRATVTYRSAVNPKGVPAVTVEASAGDLAAETALRLLGIRLLLSMSPDQVAADGIAQSDVTATLTTEDGDAVPFVTVSFGATLGTVSEGQVQTDVTGRASVVYTGVASETDVAGVEIRAVSSGLDTSISMRLLGVKLSLLASPDTIAADGNAQSTLRASVVRSDGVAIPNGMVRFETSLGTLSSASVETDGEGVAQNILVAGTEAGKATVTAVYGDGLEERVSVAFVKGPPTSIVVESVELPAIGVRGAGDNETAIVTFLVRDDRGNTVADGEPVLFRLDAPGNGGERVGPEQTATVNGRVQAAVNSGTLARTVRLIAEVPLASGDTIRSTPVPVAIHGGPPDQVHFGLSASPRNLAGRVRFGLQSMVTAYVFDKYSNPVPAGTSIQFQTNGGGIQGAAETNEDGQASVTLFTAEPIPPEADRYMATVVAQTVDETGREIQASVLVLFSGATAPIRLMGADVDTIEAGRLFIPEAGEQIVAFRVSDIDDNPLMQGSTIQVTSDVANVAGDAFVILEDAISGYTDFAITVSDPRPYEDPSEPPHRGSVLIKVESPNGNRQLTFGLTVD